MKRNISTLIYFMLLFLISIADAYTSISPAELHARLVNKDTLLILDVREWSEYVTGHIAAPAGQLPLTPACMPWNSSVLQANYGRLPKNIDIVVNCKSGGRGASASAFLEQNGFTRISNLTGGFTAWDAASYEKRLGMFGDSSGRWINPSMAKADTVTHDSASLALFPAAFAGKDSVYCEVHFAYGKQPAPADAPASDIAGLFRVTALDKFGLPLFAGDSLVLADTIGLDLTARPKSGNALPALLQTSGAALVKPGAWQTMAFDYHAPVFHRSEKVLRRWYAVSGFSSSAVRMPQPAAPHYSDRPGGFAPWRAYDLSGRVMPAAIPLTETVSSGYYIYSRVGRPGTPFLRGLRSSLP